MLYVIKDVTICPITGHAHTKVIKIVQTEYEALEYLKNPETLKQFKGDIKIDKVIL